jgi:hypothetical protein
VKPLGLPAPRALIFLIALLLVSACGRSSDRDVVTREPVFVPEGELRFERPDGSLIARIAVELAETETEQATGLMGRRSLPALGGMLFVNDSPRMQQFWMKNTPLPLDIIFIRDDLTITNIVARTQPLSEAFIESTDEAQYVLEVRAGFTEAYGIDENTVIRWQRRQDTAAAPS